MPDKHWGHCQHCRYFGSPAQLPLVEEEARCKQPDLVAFKLHVFGACGCNSFEVRPGLAETIEQAELDA